MLPQGQDFVSPTELLLLAMVAGNAAALLTAAIAVAQAFAPSLGRPHGGRLSGGRPSDAVERPARLSRALAIVRGLAIGDAAYFLVVLATTLHAPAPIPALRIGDAVCRAHRCIAVVSVDRVAITDAAPAAPSAPAPTPSTAAAHASVAVTLRLSNTSRYASHDVWPRRVFVVDDRGVRYPLDATEAPLTERLDAGELRTTIRRFTLPSTARPVGFLVEQTDGPGSGPALRCLIIDGSCWYAPPPHPAILLE